MKKLRMAGLAAMAFGLMAAQTMAATTKDTLNAPVPHMAPLTASQESVTVPTPGHNLVEVANAFNQWYAGQAGKTIVVPTGIGQTETFNAQDLAAKKVRDYIDVRVKFYETSHRWENDSYGKLALRQIGNDLKAVVPTSVNAAPEHKVDLWAAINDQKPEAQVNFDAMNLLRVAQSDTRNVASSELRTYVNQTIDFALLTTMKANEFK